MTRVEQSIEVNVPVDTVYQQLTQFEEFPRFMMGVHAVHQLDDTHLHWRAEKSGKEIEWNAEITEKIPEKCIAWRNTNEPKNEVRLTFETIAPDKTRISMSREAEDVCLSHPEFAGNRTTLPEADLARFKKMIENQEQQRIMSCIGSAASPME